MPGRSLICRINPDFLYYDNISLNQRIGKHKFAYNSGQMLQAAVLLYKITNDKSYLLDAQNIAASGYNFFFEKQTDMNGKNSKYLKKGNIWFTAIMLRGYVELYQVDKNKVYLDAFKRSLDFAWKYGRDENGFFDEDWSGKYKKPTKWLLGQAAMVEMYTRLANIN